MIPYIFSFLLAGILPTASHPTSKVEVTKLHDAAKTGVDVWERNAIATLRAMGCDLTFENAEGESHVLEVSLIRERRGQLRQEHFAVLSDLPKLKRLHLNGEMFNDRIMRYLQDLSGLKSLSIRSGALTDDGLRYLRRLKSLEELSLRGCLMITDAGIRHVSQLKNLGEIDLSETKIGDDAFDSLAKLPNLKKVILQKTRISSYGFEKVRFCPMLEEIYLHGTGLRDRALKDILRSRSIVFIEGFETWLSEEAADKAMLGRPGLKITYGGSRW